MQNNALEYAISIFFSITTKNEIKMWMEKVIRFQIAKVQPQGAA